MRGRCVGVCCGDRRGLHNTLNTRGTCLERRVVCGGCGGLAPRLFGRMLNRCGSRWRWGRLAPRSLTHSQGTTALSRILYDPLHRGSIVGNCSDEFGEVLLLFNSRSLSLSQLLHNQLDFGRILSEHNTHTTALFRCWCCLLLELLLRLLLLLFLFLLGRWRPTTFLRSHPSLS